MSSNVVLDLNAAIGSLKLVSSGSFRPVAVVDAAGLATPGLWTAAERSGDDENNRELAIWWTFPLDKLILIAGVDPSFPRNRTNAMISYFTLSLD